jgi:hypothetical protein
VRREGSRVERAGKILPGKIGQRDGRRPDDRGGGEETLSLIFLEKEMHSLNPKSLVRKERSEYRFLQIDLEIKIIWDLTARDIDAEKRKCDESGGIKTEVKILWQVFGLSALGVARIILGFFQHGHATINR